DKYIPVSLPYLLRTPSHILTTEAVALLMDRLVQDREWLEEYPKAPASLVRKLAPALADNTRLRMFIFTRWVLVMVHFERALYADPEGDLDRIWWQLVEKYQFVAPPDGRENQPDWATKTHIALSPVYYHNYLLGELMASQLEAGIRSAGPRVSRSAGDFLRERLFALGAQHDWQETVKHATGAPLTPNLWAHQLTIGG
ncbi:MAG: peptidase M3A and M3B thimet/oligopeptidase F, partial [bacterium]